MAQAKASPGMTPTFTATSSGRPGRPLDPQTLSKMEFAFGTDFSNVRVHEGMEAAAAGSIAFARGEDLYFQPGKYDPSSSQGLELIGHELAHVVQQRAGRVTAMAKGGINTDPALEREADQLGARAASGAQVGVASAGSGTASATGPMQLQADSALEFLAPLLAAGIDPGDTLTAEEEEACAEARAGGLDFLAVETPEAVLAVRVLSELVAKLDRLLAGGQLAAGYRASRAKLSRICGAWSSAASDTHDATDPADVQEWSTKGGHAAKNKLYIGGGAEITAKVASNPAKAHAKHSRILDVDDARWTWFVNTAWMEAGMQHDARFKLTTALTDDIKRLLLAGGVTGDQFLAEVGRSIAPLGTPHPLWHSGDARATYFAHEIAMLLDQGYLFEEVDRARGGGEKKQQFVRP